MPITIHTVLANRYYRLIAVLILVTKNIFCNALRSTFKTLHSSSSNDNLTHRAQRDKRLPSHRDKRVLQFALTQIILLHLHIHTRPTDGRPCKRCNHTFRNSFFFLQSSLFFNIRIPCVHPIHQNHLLIPVHLSYFSLNLSNLSITH